VVEPSELILKQTERWHHTLIHSAGCNFSHALPGATNAPLHRRAYHLYSDAALEGAPIPSIGGYFHGLWWSVPLTAAQKQIPIPHLEMIAAVVNFRLFVRTVLPAGDADLHVDIVGHMDGLAARYVLADQHARSSVMMFIHQHLLESEEYRSHAQSWSVDHTYGEANFMADAASRGLTRALYEMAAQLRVSLTKIEVPHDLSSLLDDVLDRLT
jgi:hypothetical protein